MLAEEQWALIFGAAKKRGAKWADNADVLAFKHEVQAALAGAVPMPAPAPIVFDEGAFFAQLRATKPFGPTLTATEVSGCQAIIQACRAAGWGAAWIAYAIATAFHETAGTMLPIREYGRGKGRRYGRPVAKHGGQVAYGRGYVQLTWDYNYLKADQQLALGGRLVRDYDLALDPQIAAAILVRGMAEGWFTSKKLADYLPAQGLGTLAGFKSARRIINGTDKADLIARYAVIIQDALRAGGLR